LQNNNVPHIVPVIKRGEHDEADPEGGIRLGVHNML